MNPANSPTHKPGDILELNVDSLSYSGGRGVGRHNGLVVFVPDTAPGDRIRARVTAVKPRFLEAEIETILTPSPHRRPPACPVFGRCGGCAWQHVNYSQQVVEKGGILRSSLKKLSQMTAIEWLDFIPAPEEFHYRNRIQLHVKDGEAGFYSRHSRDLVVIEKCYIADERLNAGIADARSARRHGRVEMAIRENGERVLFASDRDPHVALFGQVNSAQNENLKSLVTGAIQQQPEWILDLYAGSGNLTLPLAEAHPKARVIAVELSRNAVELGKERTRNHRVEWFAGDVARVVKKLPSLQSDNGVIVLDPPRPGCADEVVDEVIRRQPKQIVYVSCNPTTFARDMEKILRARPRDHLQVRGLDMFPQTEHVELVASLCAAP